MELKTYEIICPSCRTNNKILGNQHLVVGIDSICIVCHVNSVNVYLPSCGHTNLCLDCVKKIDITNNTRHVTEPLPIIGQILNNPNMMFHFNFDGTNDATELGAINIFGDNRNKILLCSYAGMGCYIFVRRRYENNQFVIESFFMHSDSWGQYGENTSDIQALNNFVTGYEPISNNSQIQYNPDVN